MQYLVCCVFIIFLYNSHVGMDPSAGYIQNDDAATLQENIDGTIKHYLSYNRLKETISTTYKTLKPGFILYYYDDEGDRIRISNDSELLSALDCVQRPSETAKPILRLIIEGEHNLERKEIFTQSSPSTESNFQSQSSQQMDPIAGLASQLLGTMFQPPPTTSSSSSTPTTTPTTTSSMSASSVSSTSSSTSPQMQPQAFNNLIGSLAQSLFVPPTQTQTTNTNNTSTTTQPVQPNPLGALLGQVMGSLFNPQQQFPQQQLQQQSQPYQQSQQSQQFQSQPTQNPSSRTSGSNPAPDPLMQLF